MPATDRAKVRREFDAAVIELHHFFTLAGDNRAMRLIPASLIDLLKDDADTPDEEASFDVDAAFARYMEKRAAGEVEVVSEPKTDRAYGAPRPSFGRKGG